MLQNRTRIKIFTKIKTLLIQCIKFIVDWRTLICYIPIWFAASGWTYVVLAVGPNYLRPIAAAWLAWLWMPWCPEKFVTVPLTLALKRFLFPKYTKKQKEIINYMEQTNIKVIKKTLKNINDLVTPTMGAQGRLAVLNDEFGKPILTDDGVTVAKQCLKLEGFERMIALSAIEAAHNTEKAAFDGTTLTLLLTYEFYKAGLDAIKKGMHPKAASEELLNDVAYIKTMLKKEVVIQPDDIKYNNVFNLAKLTTKIPVIGELVAKAWEKAGNGMNIVIEHDRINSEHSIDYTNGMIIDEGYYSEAFRNICDSTGKYIRNNAHIVLLQEGYLSPNGIKTFFGSIDEKTLKEPFIVFMDKNFNPDSMKNIMDIMVQAKMDFIFVMINDTRSDEVFLDLAAYTNGKVQDASFGTTNYELQYCGLAEYICVEQDKTTITISEKTKAEIEPLVAIRLNSYNEELKDKKYNQGIIRETIINKRIANLTSGIAKIKVATPTITEFMTYKLKLDDAIGAVRCALKSGLVLGGGKTLWNISETKGIKGKLRLDKVLKKPLKIICKNAGVKIDNQYLNNEYVSANGYDVNTGEQVDLYLQGILDSYESIEAALDNAASIASQYIKAYVVIK